MAEHEAQFPEPRDAKPPLPPAGPAAEAAERILQGRIRAPEGIFARRWLNTAGADQPPCTDLNAIFAALHYWIPRDPSLADELIQSAFALQDPGGALHRRFGSDGRVLDGTAPWPALLTAAAPRFAASADLADALLPKAEAYVRWAYAVFDPDRNGRPHWPSAHGALIPESWEPGLSSVDLTILLLSEISVLRGLCADGLVLRRPHDLDEMEQVLQRALASCAVDGAPPFRDRYFDGRIAQRITLSCYFPLWLDGLAPETRERLASHLEMGPCACADGGLYSWEPWADDPAPPPVSPALQLFILGAWERADRGSARRAAAALRSLLERTWAARGMFPADLTSGAPAPEPAQGPDLIAAAALAAPPMEGTPRQSARGAWLERHRRALLGGALALIILPLIGTVVYFRQRTMLPGSSMESLILLGRESLQAGRLDQAEMHLRDFIRRVPGTHGVAHMLLGNTLYRQGRYAEAETQYRIALQDKESSTHALYNLGLTLHRLDRLPEAENCMQTFVDEFSNTLPQFSDRARLALDIIRQQRKAREAAESEPAPSPPPAS
ncbi:MAG: tetratricopeptide repeat protein [Kiritimatiellae bacterium]|nr:tetratricopeptide repeat protein [Kiritimatiellia bacterium]